MVYIWFINTIRFYAIRRWTIILILIKSLDKNKNAVVVGKPLFTNLEIPN